MSFCDSNFCSWSLRHLSNPPLCSSQDPQAHTHTPASICLDLLSIFYSFLTTYLPTWVRSMLAHQPSWLTRRNKKYSFPWSFRSMRAHPHTHLFIIEDFTSLSLSLSLSLFLSLFITFFLWPICLSFKSLSMFLFLWRYHSLFLIIIFTSVSFNLFHIKFGCKKAHESLVKGGAGLQDCSSI